MQEVQAFIGTNAEEWQAPHVLKIADMLPYLEWSVCASTGWSSKASEGRKGMLPQPGGWFLRAYLKNWTFAHNPELRIDWAGCPFDQSSMAIWVNRLFSDASCQCLTLAEIFTMLPFFRGIACFPSSWYQPVPSSESRRLQEIKRRSSCSFRGTPPYMPLLACKKDTSGLSCLLVSVSDTMSTHRHWTNIWTFMDIPDKELIFQVNCNTFFRYQPDSQQAYLCLSSMPSRHRRTCPVPRTAYR